MLLALGSNGSGQLGLNHEDDAHTPCICSNAENFVPAFIKAGGNHTLLLTTDGKIYVSGANPDGRCGEAASLKNSTTFKPLVTKVDEPNGFGLCAATWEASILVSKDGCRVYTSGSGNRGELGQQRGNVKSFELIMILNTHDTGTRVVDIAACMSHAVAVMADGTVYGWGSGRKGQVGEPKEDVWAPRLIGNIPFKAARAVCGKDFTCVLSSPKDGQCLVLGSDKWDIISSAPSLVKGWIDIGASWGSVQILSEAGELQGWGRNDHGQLCPPNIPKIATFAAGSEHTVALTRSGQVLAWGWGEHGNCGRPTFENGDVAGRCNELATPIPPSFVSAGCATSWMFYSE